jgi:hypothetical protein
MTAEAKRTGWLRSGDGPLSVRARPSSIKRDCDRRTMSTGRTCLADVHAKSRLILETSAGTPVRRRGPGGACPDRTRAIPCKVTRASRVIRILHDTAQPDGRQHRGRDMIAALERHFLSGESRRRRSVNAELLAPQRNECRENIQRLGKGWRRGSYLGLDGRDQAPAHLLAELQVHVPVPL